LTLALEHEIKTLAFPGISTGVYHFPKERAAKIAFGHVYDFLMHHPFPQQVTFCCYSQEDAAVYQQVIDTRNIWMTSRKRVAPF
jgi:O-acetyl-ADP-ribose deacetylase (regulator of RNase III)